MGTKTLALALAIGIAALPRDAGAQQGNYRATPIGGRSALMGGTGIALARDGSAPFLNPARIAEIRDDSVAFSVNFYSYSNTHFTSFHQPGAVDRNAFGPLQLPSTSLDQSRFDALPSTLCLFFTVAGWGEKKGRQKLAACLGTLERQELQVTAARYLGGAGGEGTHQTQSFIHSWNRFHVGPTFSAYLTDRLVLGASLHGIETAYTSIVSSNDATTTADARAITSSYDSAASAHSFDLGAVVGLTYHLDSVYTLGLSATSPTLHVAGGYDTTRASAFSGAGSASTLDSATGDFVANAPIRVGAGLGAEYGRFRLEVDAIYYFARSDATSSTLHVTETSAGAQRSYDVAVKDRADAILNSAFGLEYYLSPAISLLGGASTDFSAVPIVTSARPPDFGQVTTSRLNRVAGSFGIGSHGGGSELLLGAELSYGWGRAFVPNQFVLPNQLALTEQSTFAVLLVVGGTTSIEAFKRTASDLGDVVKNAVQRK